MTGPLSILILGHPTLKFPPIVKFPQPPPPPSPNRASSIYVIYCKASEEV